MLEQGGLHLRTSLSPHWRRGFDHITKMRTKALPAALQVAWVVTSTDWSSNGNPIHPAPGLLSTMGCHSRPRGGGPRSRAEAGARWGLGEAVEAAPFQVK